MSRDALFGSITDVMVLPYDDPVRQGVIDGALLLLLCHWHCESHAPGIIAYTEVLNVMATIISRLGVSYMFLVFGGSGVAHGITAASTHPSSTGDFGCGL